MRRYLNFAHLGRVQSIWAAVLRHDEFVHVMGNIFWLLLYANEKYFGHMCYLLLINVLIVMQTIIKIVFALDFECMLNDDSLLTLRYQGISGVIYGLRAIKYFYLRPIWTSGIGIIDTSRLLIFKELLEFTAVHSFFLYPALCGAPGCSTNDLYLCKDDQPAHYPHG